MNKIILSGKDGLMTITDSEGNDVPACELTSGTWRIVRRDDWEHDERVLNALRVLGAQPDVTLVDPTGLLGGSRYGEERNAHGEPERRPIVQTSRRHRVAGTNRDRTWR